jgi:hypothetical protein
MAAALRVSEAIGAPIGISETEQTEIILPAIGTKTPLAYWSRELPS